MKHSYKFKNNKKAFTLIELLIVIAIIGILFIVLVSKVDFATDKAKATGVQTDFRSFQVALDQVAKENAGFNIFGWDTGDTNGDHIRNSYDRGDTNKNGKEDPGETFIGRKEYGEDWTTIYTMLNPDTTKADDISAFVALEQAINANLDPKLHITITPDVEAGVLTGNATITMANQARDPWKNEYHGVFITNAVRDNGADRGAIIIYSNGANGKWGSAHDITNGVVSVTVPNNNKLGQDDYSIVSFYTYTNGYGEVLNMTTGFSNNQNFLNGGGTGNFDTSTEPTIPDEEPMTQTIAGLYVAGSNYTDRKYTWDEMKAMGWISNSNTVVSTYAEMLDGDVLYPSNVSLWSDAFKNCVNLTGLYIPANIQIPADIAQNTPMLQQIYIEDGITTIPARAFRNAGMKSIRLPNTLSTIAGYAFNGCPNLVEITIPNSVTSMSANVFADCTALTKVSMPTGLTRVPDFTFDNCTALKNVVLPNTIKEIGNGAFSDCSALTNIDLTNIQIINQLAFYRSGLTSVTLPSIITIGEQGFGYCSQLVTANLYDAPMTTLGTSVFYLCSALTDINLPHALETIETEAFRGASSLNNVVLPNTVKALKIRAFYDCTSLTNLVINEGLTTLEYMVFESSGLTNITIPSSVTSIDARALQSNKLKNITFNGSVDDWLNASTGVNWQTSLNSGQYIYCTDGTISRSGITYN